ncbi:response regulator [Chenggangzhangella methanolivorans]|uniref:Response regulator n=1 Tax=Chenggangzhangella methanolivorans TaxID=1437009 RepID=A0A9E6RCZ6_9HYPH|nr:response regulator [Chenggangzhangella methanolivorans]QZO00973.1 response regulator [Chenggangzhangella methanolivorans]
MRVLIVEDDMAVAGALSPLVTEAGHELVGLAADRDTAIALLASTTVHLALIDLRLADGWTGADVARAAAARDIAGVFTTANPSMLPADLAGACAVMAKPYSPRLVTAALTYIAARVAGEATGAPPKGLDLGPRWLGSGPLPSSQQAERRLSA